MSTPAMRGRARPAQRRAPSGEPSRTVAVALSIAGSDSGGGAGIAADLKAFARCGVHGACAITAVTAQSTTGVHEAFALDPALVLAQVRAVAADIGVDAVKIGMLGSAAVARAVVTALDELPAATPVVLDPVLRATSGGAALLDDAAREVLVGELLPRASVVTPNLSEAGALLGRAGEACEEAAELARALLELGPGAVVLTGGHARAAQGRAGGAAEVIDVFVAAQAPERVVELVGERFEAGGDHGSGCTHSAALAAQLALGHGMLEAARRARALTGAAIRDGLRELGAGNGPVDVIGVRRAPPAEPPRSARGGGGARRRPARAAGGAHGRSQRP